MDDDCAELRDWCLCWCIFAVIPCLLLFTGILCLATLGDRDPLYSAAIGSVSGLDDADLGRRPTELNPLFNLTLRVTTRSIFSSGCTHPGAVVEVTYAGVKLAAGPVERFCAKPWKAKEMAMLAWGTAVQVPGFALYRLAGDVRHGVGVFDVAVTMPSTHDSEHHGKLVSCRGLHVGDDSTLRAPCAVADVDTVMPVPSSKDGGT
ncbi:unnamed protein product [Alopecurus aequalis]